VRRGAFKMACSFRRGALRQFKLGHVSTYDWSFDRFRTILISYVYIILYEKNDIIDSTFFEEVY